MEHLSRTFDNAGNSGGDYKARCDKVTILVSQESDAFGVWYRAFQSTVEAIAEANACTIPLSVRVRANTPETGHRLYEVDTYGAGSDTLLRLLPENLWDSISRVDYRYDVPIDESKLFAFARWVEEHGRYGRNVNYFNTRPRNKTEGRHAGGKGVSVGSHKSDTRIVVYKRTGEQGAIEFHITGAALDAIISTARGLTKGPLPLTFYDAVMRVLEGRTNAVLKQSGFKDVSTLIALVGTDTQAELDFDAMQSNVMIVKAAINGMTGEQRQVFVAALGLTARDLK